MSLLVTLALLIPIAEIWTAIQVARHIGWLATIVLVVLISACGPALVRRQGIGVWRRARQRLQEGDVPGRELMDGVLLLIAGGLLTFPGFITSVVGLLLLLPPVRRLVRAASGAWLVGKVERSAAVVRVSLGGRRNPFGRGGPAMTAQSHPVEGHRPRVGPAGDRTQPTQEG